MRMFPVESSHIAEIGYDAAEKRLRVRFKDGAVHDKTSVSAEEFAAFQSAQSLGAHFHQHFRGHTTRALQDVNPQRDPTNPFAPTETSIPEFSGTQTRSDTLDQAIERFTRGVQ